MACQVFYRGIDDRRARRATKCPAPAAWLSHLPPPHRPVSRLFFQPQHGVELCISAGPLRYAHLTPGRSSPCRSPPQPALLPAPCPTRGEGAVHAATEIRHHLASSAPGPPAGTLSTALAWATSSAGTLTVSSTIFVTRSLPMGLMSRFIWRASARKSGSFMVAS